MVFCSNKKQGLAEEPDITFGEQGFIMRCGRRVRRTAEICGGKHLDDIVCLPDCIEVQLLDRTPGDA